MTNKPVDALNLKVLTGYGVMTIPLAVAGLPVLIFLPAYFAQDLGLEIGLLGMVLMLSRFFDMVSDPVVGILSDRTRTPFGRRRPWILIGAIVMMVATWKVFLSSHDINEWELGGWMILFYLGWTMITVPYTAWGVELSDDYYERTRVAGARETFSVLGMILVFVGAGVVTEDLPVGVSETPAIVEAMGWLTLLLLPICTAVLFFTVKDRAKTGRSEKPVKLTLAEFSGNRPFLLLITAAFISELGIAINNSVLIIFYDNVVGLPDRVDDFVGIYFGCALLGIPLWLWLGQSLGKHRAVCIAAIWNALSLLILLFIEQGDFQLYALIEASRGLAFAGPLVLGASMIADVVEYHSWRNGSSRAGLITAFWITGSKLAGAIGIGIALPALGWVGFQAGHENTEEVLQGITVIYALIPAALALLSIPFVWGFPLTAKRNRIVKRALEKRNEREELLLTLPY